MARELIHLTDERAFTANTSIMLFEVTVPNGWIWHPTLLVVNAVTGALPTVTALVQIMPTGKTTWFDIESLALASGRPTAAAMARVQPTSAWGQGDKARLTLRTSANSTLRTLVTVIHEEM